MKIEDLKKQLRILVAIVIVFLALIYFGGVRDYAGRNAALQLSSPKQTTGVLMEGTELRQAFMPMEACLYHFAVNVTEGSHAVFSYTFAQNGQVLAQNMVDQPQCAESIELIYEPLTVSKDDYVTLTIHIGAGNETSFFYGDTYQLARGEAAISGLNADTCLYISGQQIYGKISAEGNSVTSMNVEGPFLVVACAAIIWTVLWAFWVVRQEQQGKTSIGYHLIYTFNRYWFVMSQMIGRDFKTKYKRSVLGVFWSFLNPLLTMGVQYLVFSTIFKSDIAYFPVYLMTGIVCFNFFSEGTNAGLSSITGNTSLLTKVYIPKYIFPISRVLSAGINFLFSLIPLLIILLVSGLKITRAYLILPYPMLCLLMLVIGVAMLLGTMMVFFRDMQFLWGVVMSLMMYVTPIFYPESILGDKLIIIAKLNPLYHVIRFMRSVIIDGAAPEPKAYLLCFIACCVPALIGVWVFKRNQDKFILNL